MALVQNRLNAGGNRPEIQVFQNSDRLPKLECYASQINQVLMSSIGNLIEAIDEKYRSLKAFLSEIPSRKIRTEIVTQF